jgi:hypothetical protein
MIDLRDHFNKEIYDYKKENKDSIRNNTIKINKN